ncbi:homocysteine S-methyltransferase family protein [uncultured Tateyamaria sp.]|uniref:homocysteine S-methyltransferase family protein n=1 Tax=uncultured Tateyamaria sp. TaxID=455651 RepID=UPI00261C8CE2|nr:homocysteine S-methyltransferase family protein [uncultured Tateyamaria sp.]
MTAHARPIPLPHLSSERYLLWEGNGTDLIFNRGVDMPGFASFPLLANPDTRAVLAQQLTEFLRLAQDLGRPCIVGTHTWQANPARAGRLGYSRAALDDINREAALFLRETVAASGNNRVLCSGLVGPRDDPYADAIPMGVEEARVYHTPQIAQFQGAGLDFIGAFTLNKPKEAAGLAVAAREAGLPVVLSLVVETDGRLANGQTLDDAIAEIDRLSDTAPAYFMVNCAHPSHIAPGLTGNPRLRGLIVNASRCSHAELDEATELDAGDPAELGREMAALLADNPHVRVFGGCCGTDLRHINQMSEAVGR